jgi:hypothetical protein
MNWIARYLPGGLAVQLVVAGFTYFPGDDGGKFGAPIPMGSSVSLWGGNMNGADGLIALILFAVNILIAAGVLALAARISGRGTWWGPLPGALIAALVIVGSYVLCCRSPDSRSRSRASPTAP